MALLSVMNYLLTCSHKSKPTRTFLSLISNGFRRNPVVSQPGVSITSKTFVLTSHVSPVFSKHDI